MTQVLLLIKVDEADLPFDELDKDVKMELELDERGPGLPGVLVGLERAEFLRERIAEKLYHATMGQAAILPWPASNPDMYRRLADAVLTELFTVVE